MRRLIVSILSISTAIALSSCDLPTPESISAAGGSGRVPASRQDLTCPTPVGEPGPGANGTFECVPIDQLPPPPVPQFTEMPADAPAEAVAYAEKARFIGGNDNSFPTYHGVNRIRGFSYSDGTVIIESFYEVGGTDVQTIYDVRLDEQYK